MAPLQSLNHSGKLCCLVLVLFTHLHLSYAQQIGSFFTAIYLNGAPVSVGQSTCDGMGQGQYCCASGQSCSWDDAGQVACCASGSSCHGSAAYSQGAGAPVTSAWQPSPSWAPVTTTVYPQPSTTDCQCEQQATTTYVAPVPIAPVTRATLVTSYYAPQTTTYVPQETQEVTVVAPAGGISTVGPVACATVSTVTYANVGAPVRTVGCFVIINSAERKLEGWGRRLSVSLAFWFLATLIRKY